MLRADHQRLSVHIEPPPHFLFSAGRSFSHVFARSYLNVSPLSSFLLVCTQVSGIMEIYFSLALSTDPTDWQLVACYPLNSTV